jgi:hypothetical protein
MGAYTAGGACVAAGARRVKASEMISKYDWPLERTLDYVGNCIYPDAAAIRHCHTALFTTSSHENFFKNLC